MKVIKRTFLTAAVTLFAAALCLLLTGLVLAACSEKVTLRFVTNGGTELESVEGAVGAAYRIPSDPEKEGYFFDGWYLQSDFSGERQELPEKMPQRSTTYYAKYVPYAYLTLDSCGGEPGENQLRVKPGVKIADFVKDYAPQKEGLLFGGWMKDGSLLAPDAVMPEGELTLTARYRAEYAVNIYVQDPDEPEKFEQSGEWSGSGADWEGETLAPELPRDEHLYLDPEREAVFERVLGAGENVLNFYYLREEIELSYVVAMRGGEVKTRAQKTRYGAHVPLWEGPEAAEGELLYGWAESENSGAKYLPGESVTVGAQDMKLYGTWAKKYSDAKLGGFFAVEEISSGGKHSARYVAANGAPETGVFDEAENFFEAENSRGRLDGKGYFLSDDSGTYQGYDLSANETNAEKYGALTLDFKQGSAEFELGGEKTKGTYEYLWDESAQTYQGAYRFTAENGETFSFALDERETTFRREGAEKGKYALFGSEGRSEFQSLSLDGFGGALLSDCGKEIEGSYLGAGSANEWLFGSDEYAFRFLTGTQSWCAGGGTVANERVYFVYSEELSGRYTGAGTLSLDGYGVCGEYAPPNGKIITGSFTRDGVFLTLHGAQDLRFTLQGGSFSLTGEEAGEYVGAMGKLFLDGGGQATLQTGERTVSGTYVRGGAGEFTFQSEQAGQMRFKLSAHSYAVYNPSLSGNFAGKYGGKLSLDGFGGGSYLSDEGKEISVTVGYHDAAFLELFSPDWLRPHYFKLNAGGEMSLLSDSCAGVYRVKRSGSFDGTLLVLGGGGSAKLCGGQSGSNGSYRELENHIVKFLLEGKENLYFLTEKNGAAVAVEFEGEGTYTGADGETLVLNGYESAVYTAGAQRLEGEYVLFGSAAELSLKEGLYRFELSGFGIVKTSYYEKTEGEKGVLYLEKDGADAILRGENEEMGAYMIQTSPTGQYYVFEGGENFSFKREADRYRLYDKTKEAVYQSEDGGTLSLDGCGRGVFVRREVRAEGEVSYGENGLILFCSQNLEKSGVRAFRVFENGALEILGAEYGEYLRGGQTLFLDGEGGAQYLGVSGKYEATGGGEYLFSGGGVSFRFRLEGATFLRYSETLAALAGDYETEMGTLSVTGYGVSLKGADQTENLNVCYATNGWIFAKDETGALFGFSLEGTSAAAFADCRFLRGVTL